MQLDRDAFDKCRSTGAATGIVRGEAQAARAIGVSGTPTFFIGTRNDKGEVRVKRRMAGALKLDTLEPVVEQLLQGK
jgi:predicted DsbA family dithiol-disulfide isomerase